MFPWTVLAVSFHLSWTEKLREVLPLVVCVRGAQEIVWMGAGRGAAGLSGQGSSHRGFSALCGSAVWVFRDTGEVQKCISNPMVGISMYVTCLSVGMVSIALSLQTAAEQETKSLRKSPLMSSWCLVLCLLCGIEP